VLTETDSMNSDCINRGTIGSINSEANFMSKKEIRIEHTK